MIRVRNNHPVTPLQCSGRILNPGVWVEVDQKFFEGFSTVPHLEFEEIGPDRMTPEPPMQPTGTVEADEPPPDTADGQAAPPFEQGRAAALASQPEDSCPYPDGRTKDAKEWRRGFREASS